MPLASFLESLFKWLFLLALAVAVVTWFYKDKLPEPGFYINPDLADPRQTPTARTPFSTSVNGQTYLITPKFDYEFEAIVVSYHDADAFTDISHFSSWKDFINLRDLCVVWGENLRSGVYQRMKFHNDSWTCWVQWQAQDASLFRKDQLSNNHLLSDSPRIQQAILDAEPGDHIRIRGMLVEYANPGNGFKRGTSTTRMDTGNGACETIYVTDFAILQKANAGARSLYRFSFWLAVLGLIGFVIFLFIAPPKNNVA